MPFAVCAALALAWVGRAGSQEQVERDIEPRRNVIAERAAFELTSAIGAEAVLNRSPQFVPSSGHTQFATNEIQSSAGNAVGSSTINLRGLGANRTLVLIDGQRAMPVSATMVVDANMIPTTALERVEIVSGGASAAYGAGAVGGVVDFVLRDDFEGATVDVRVGDTEHGGSQEVTLAALLGAGFGADRGNVMIGIERSTRTKQRQWERDWRVEQYADPNVNGTAFFGTETWIGNVQGTFGNLPSQALVNQIFGAALPCADANPNDAVAGVCPTANGLLSNAPGAGGYLGVPNGANFYVNRTIDGSGTVFAGLNAGNGAAGAYRYAGPFDGDPYGRFAALPFRKVQPDGRLAENALWNWASIPLERVASFAKGTLEVSDSVRIESQAFFTRTETETSLGLTADAVGVWGAEVPFGTSIYAPSVTSLGADARPNTGDAGEDMTTRAAYRPAGLYGLDGMGGATTVWGSYACPAVGGCQEWQAWPLPPEVVNLMASRPNPEANVWVNRPLDFMRESLGSGMASRNRTDTVQLALGLEGDLSSDHHWNLSVSTGRSSTVNSLRGAARLSQWRRIVGSPNFGVGFQADANPSATGFGEGIATCRTGLPLVRTFEPSDDCIRALGATPQNETELEQGVLEANVLGSLAQMRAGELRYALGTTYREASFEYETDDLTAIESITDSVMGLFPQTSSTGSFDVAELHGALSIPIVAQGPTGAESLSLELSGRTSDYSSVGTVGSYGAVIDWAPAPKYRLRAGWNRAHRAPSLAELYSGRTQLFNFRTSSYGDQCSQNNRNSGSRFSANPATNVEGAAGAANTLALCRQLMGPSAAFEYYDNRPLAQQPSASTAINNVGIENTRGNPHLAEERADSFTLGAVLAFLDDWTLAVDYYTIEIDDVIALESPDAVYERCFSPERNPTFSPAASGCSAIVRDALNGNAAQVDLSYTNLGRAITSGVDLQLNWSRELAAGGLDVSVLANINLESVTQVTPAARAIDWAGTRGCQLQMECAGYDYRILTSVGYFRNDWGVQLRHQYWPAIRDGQFAQNPTPPVTATNSVASYQLFALSASYRFRDKHTLRVGIDNLFDREPPKAGGNPRLLPFPTAPTFQGGATYDPLGRRGFVSLTLEF